MVVIPVGIIGFVIATCRPVSVKMDTWAKTVMVMVIIIIIQCAAFIIISIIRSDICLGDPCGSHGQCSHETDEPYYNCMCDLGYSEKNCSVYVCNPNPCQNNGKCEPDADSSPKEYKCTCPDEFSGEDCEIGKS
jgi:hypothetical protein